MALCSSHLVVWDLISKCTRTVLIRSSGHTPVVDIVQHRPTKALTLYEPNAFHISAFMPSAPSDFSVVLSMRTADQSLSAAFQISFLQPFTVVNYFFAIHFSEVLTMHCFVLPGDNPFILF